MDKKFTLKLQIVTNTGLDTEMNMDVDTDMDVP
jgi:hypothetical protein